MRPVRTEPIRLGSSHCCQCTAARGSACGHIGGPMTCRQHADIRNMREPRPPWWQFDDTDPYRPPAVSWD